MLKALLWFIIVFHMGVVFGNLIAVPILLFGSTPWFQALPLVTFIGIVSCTRIECPLTRLENAVREELGMPRIGGFVKHYFLTPLRQHWHHN